MGCSTRLGPSARIEGSEGVHRITKCTSILNAIRINQRLPFPSLPFPRRATNGKPCVFPPLLYMGVRVYMNSDCGVCTNYVYYTENTGAQGKHSDQGDESCVVQISYIQAAALRSFAISAMDAIDV